MILLSSIIINYSFIFLFISFVISVLLSYFLYRKHTSLLNVPNPIKLILSLLRFLSFFLLFLLLLQPEFKKQIKTKEFPRIVFLQDNSASIVSNKDSLYYKVDYLSFVDSLFQSLNTNIDIFSFDNSIIKGLSNFKGKATNLSAVLKDVSDLYGNINVGAYILASDGIYNQGVNPTYLKSYLNAPLYTIMLGDTTQKRDVSISSIRHNKISYLGNRTPVEIVLKSHQIKGENVLLEVFDQQSVKSNNPPIYSEKIDIVTEKAINKINFYISPSKPGLQNYLVKLKSSVFEENVSNNKKSFFIDIIDDRKKILILFSSPHPDVAAIKESLETHDQYEIEAKWISDDNSSHLNFLNKNKYDLVILHQLPAHGKFKDIQSKLDNIPTWTIVGKNSDLQTFNETQDFVKFKDLNSAFEFSNIALNTNFESFSISDSLSDFLSLSTPFLVPFSNISIFNLSDIFLYKKVGSLNTGQPLLFFVDGEYNSAYLIGEGLWRWRLNDTYLNGNNLLFHDFISNIIQYLFSDEDKSRFHVDYNAVQSSNERVVFEAELYDKNFELTTDYNINMNIVDSLGNEFNYQFYPIEQKYYLDINLLQGNYSFIADVTLGDENFTKKGDFLISNFSLEERDLVANHTFLSDLALSHGGVSINKDSLGYLLKEVISSPDFKPRTYINYDYQALINFKSFLFLIILFLFLEWFLRRRYINY